MFCFFFFNVTATTEIYTLSLHDALPISEDRWIERRDRRTQHGDDLTLRRSEEHTSELQSLRHLVCRLLLEKKKRKAVQLATETPRYTRVEQSPISTLHLTAAW